MIASFCSNFDWYILPIYSHIIDRTKKIIAKPNKEITAIAAIPSSNLIFKKNFAIRK